MWCPNGHTWHYRRGGSKNIHTHDQAKVDVLEGEIKHLRSEVKDRDALIAKLGGNVTEFKRREPGAA